MCRFRFLQYFLAAAIGVGFAPYASADPTDSIPYSSEELLRPGGSEQLAHQYKTLAAKNPGNLLLQEKAALLYFIAWQFEKKDLKRRHELAKSIISLGRGMIKIAPEKPHGYHWYGVGVGLLGLSRGVLNSLQLVAEGKRALEKSIEINRSYLDGTSLLTLGRVYMLLPGFPLSIGNIKEAALDLTNGAKINAHWGLGPLYLADLDWYLDRKEEALAKAEQLLATDPTPDYTEYEIVVLEIAKEKARELQRRIKAGEKRDRYGDWIWMAELKPGLVD